MTEVPAWGTPLPVEDETRYTVAGFYAATDQRFVHHVTAVNARAAEDEAVAEFGGQFGDDGVPCQLYICGVFAIVNGQIQAVDSYATYLDPDEPERSQP